ncbi:hypothetical protein B0H67DRAFT_643559 [Lasiosphaeris hirsuta]|uniref:Uncharacterized protein n=1 Tax=Lasiosphaeris hirsuta TaxID=260670 RepID=A0AA40AQS8_9PEZI|nr:hypothetical protein B0H67DRAFT_643559 [Lasiosphaeris hirsuta]
MSTSPRNNTVPPPPPFRRPAWHLRPFRNFADLCERWGHPPASLDASGVAYLCRGLARERNGQPAGARYRPSTTAQGGWLMARAFLRGVGSALPSGAGGGWGRNDGGHGRWYSFSEEYLDDSDGGGGGRYEDENESDDEPEINYGGSDSDWSGRKDNRYGYDSDDDSDSDDHDDYNLVNGDGSSGDCTYEYGVDGDGAVFNGISDWTATRSDVLIESGVQLPKESTPAREDDNAGVPAEDAQTASRTTQAELDALAVKIFGDEEEALRHKRFLQDTGYWWEWILKLVVKAEEMETSAVVSKEMVEKLEAKNKSQEALFDRLRSFDLARHFQAPHRSGMATAPGFGDLGADETQTEPDGSQLGRVSSADKETENDSGRREESTEEGGKESLDSKVAPSPESGGKEYYLDHEFSKLVTADEEEPHEAEKEALRLRRRLQSARRDMITLDIWSRFVEATLTRELAVLAQTREIILDDLFCEGSGKGEDEGRLGFVSEQKPYTALLRDDGPSSLWKEVPWMKGWASKDKIAEAHETFVQYAMKRWNNGGDIWEIRKKMEDVIAKKGFGV